MGYPDAFSVETLSPITTTKLFTRSAILTRRSSSENLWRHGTGWLCCVTDLRVTQCPWRQKGPKDYPHPVDKIRPCLG